MSEQVSYGFEIEAHISTYFNFAFPPFFIKPVIDSRCLPCSPIEAVPVRTNGLEMDQTGGGPGSWGWLAHERRQRLLGAAALQPPSLMRMCYRGLDGRRSGFLMLEQSPFLKCDFPSVIAICINFYIIRRFSVADDSSLLLRLMPACPPDCPFSKLEQLMPPPALPPSESDLHARLAVAHEDR